MLPDAGQYKPSEHRVQYDKVVLPVEGLYVPAGQGVLAEFPVEGQYAPAGQEVQSVE